MKKSIKQIRQKFLEILKESDNRKETDKDIDAYIDKHGHLNITCYQPFNGDGYIYPSPEYITYLDASKLSIPNVTDYSYMFYCYKKIKTIKFSLLNTSNTINMSNMFCNCESLALLKLNMLNTSNVTDIDCMFNRCKSLYNLDISSFDFSNIELNWGMFDHCSSLTILKFGKNLKKTLMLSDCPLLTYDSILSVIDGLAKVEETQELILNDSSMKKLSKDDIKAAEDKNWKIVNIKNEKVIKKCTVN